MKLQKRQFALVLASFFAMALILGPYARAQQTLGGITGAVTDSSGAVVVNATVTVVGDQTKLTREQTTNASGIYSFVNLPIGAYTVTVTQAGFQSQTIPAIVVQANRTVTLNAELKVGNVSESITVEETPLLNAVDTTNGYVMDKLQIDAVPLPTGSFTGLTILSPGVNAELSGGTGANAGLGNAPVWANGQRDTSNTFLLNGVDARSLFNGKSTSQVASARVVNNTGVSGASSLSAIPVQSSASVYLAIGESIPSPAPETISEVRVNTSMYDAQQGSTSGAHIDMSTASGTNTIHGTAYVHRGTNWLNADPYFYNADPNIPANEKNPGLHRYTAGGAVGLPIKKDKLFFYGSYQQTRASDDEIGISRAFVPPDLTNDRSLAGLAALASTDTTFASPLNTTFEAPVTVTPNFTTTPCGSGNTDTCGVNPIAYTLFNYKLPNGQFLIPSANPNSVVKTSGAGPLATAFPEDAEVPGTAVFMAKQAVADLDWNPNSAHSFSAKYYYQHDPTIAPYGYSMFAGFAQHLDAGSQVISLSHTQILKSNLSVTETFGFIREKAYSTMDQPFTTAQFASACKTLVPTATTADCTINSLGSSFFPGISLVFAGTTATPYPYSMNVGAGAASEGAFTGVFQNRFNPSANAIWTLGRHTITFGGSFAYTQLNTKDQRDQQGMIASADFTNFMVGNLTPNYVYNITALLIGNANRYWRANETGEYIQDKFQWKSNLAITAGLRFDWDGGLTEKNGNLLNFDPSKYSYNPLTDTITSNGLIVAGNNPTAGTPGVSKTTLTGRQWGFAPRIGVAWSPKMFNSKVVVRAGWGMYYDRGELFAYLSPGLSQNITGGGPFGVNQQQPFVGTLSCGITAPCAGNDHVPTLQNPYGTAADLAIAKPTGTANGIVLPNACTFANFNNPSPVCSPLSENTSNPTPFYLGAYARNNKLPYTMNSTLDIQWQPRNDLAIDIGYVNALGRHEIIPIPFNQARIASPSNPLCGPAPKCANPGASPFAQSYTYGFTLQQNQAGCNIFGNFCPANLPNEQPYLANPEGGNVDLRVPYIGFGAESELYTAEGISAYNALQVHVEKRISHGLQAGFSYTFSRSFDEQSALGLFYNGNNPLNIRDGYGPSDFDRTHVFNITYHYELPKFVSSNSWESKVTNGWALQGLITLQSGQPYSVIDYSGAVGSVFYSIFDGITNPIDPLASGCTPQSALTGAVGNNPNAPALKASCFALPLLAPGALNGAIPGASSNNAFGDTFETNFTTGQRNIFRQSWQRVANISLEKTTPLTERVSLAYSFDVFNLTNTPSFDIPIDNVTQNLNFSAFPVAGLCPSPTISTSGCDNTLNFGSPFFNAPGGLGQVTKTIGSSRQIQMTLSLSF
ncbi:MAG: TonB-dependent receptor [Acidobacteriia bacterium]|nr:TonB-dependent receptor [Terriglobia bacterium]